MKIDYDRVFELLQDEDFKETIEMYFLFDLKAKLEGTNEPPFSVIYLALSLSLGKDVPLDQMPESDEFAAYLKENAEYIKDITKKIIETPLKKWLAENGMSKYGLEILSNLMAGR